MAERKFTRGLSKLGSAAQVRESVSEVVRQTAVLAKPQLVEPLDFETFVAKNQTAISNDPHRDMLAFPEDDIHQSTIPRRSRTTSHGFPFLQLGSEIRNLFVLECLKTYATCWNLIHFKYSGYSGDFMHVPRISKSECLDDLVYELDTVTAEKDIDFLLQSTDIIKQGFLLESTESSSDGMKAFSTKSFRKKYVYLRKATERRFVLDFHKDNRKTDPTFNICLNLCTDVIKNPKSGKYSFELKMQEPQKSFIFSAENEEELEDWLKLLRQVVSFCKQQRRMSLDLESQGSRVPDGSQRTSAVNGHLNSDVTKYEKETVKSIAVLRKENRQNIFAIYPDILTMPEGILAEETDAEPYKEHFGTRVFVKCENLRFNLQMPAENDSCSLSQVEPYVTTLALFNAKAGKKISADFKFDINAKSSRRMLPTHPLWKNLRPEEDGGGGGASKNGPYDSTTHQVLSHLDGFENWISYPNQAIFNVSLPDPDIYLVIRIEKVLQGSTSQAVDPYLRAAKTGGDLRIGCKMNKNARASCLRLGNYFMPLAWTAKPLFRVYGREVDTYQYCNTICKQEGSHLSDEHIVKYLAEWRKPDKKLHVVNVPGSFKMAVEPLQSSIENCVSASALPVSPFPWPPSTEPTIEVDEFPIQEAENVYPFVSYANRLYVLPKSLQFESQKSFAKARNIACIIEFRDSDDDGAIPLKCVFGRPGEPLFVNQVRCAVTYHSTNPCFYEEVKIEIPPQLHEKHHILFIFRHISCEIPKGTKKKEQPTEIPVGFAWLPLLSSERIVVKEQLLPVSENLPPGYLSWKANGSPKKTPAADIHWVDGGKPLFKVDMRIFSTVYTLDQHLNGFFSHVHKLLDSNYQMPTAEVSKHVKALHAMDTGTLIKFLPTILNQLFQLLVSPVSDTVALDIVRVFIFIANTIQDVGKLNVLRSYVKYVFVAKSEVEDEKFTVHEQLTKTIIKTLRPANADFVVINQFLRNSWFFFQTIIKSMAQHLLSTGKIKINRHERFSADYQFRIQNLTQVLIPHITQKFKDFPEETRRSNRSLGHFIKKCFNLMDRGFVFKLINFYVDKFNLGDPKTLQEYKFEFLQIVFSHEHYVPLNLPSTVCSFTSDFQPNLAELEHELQLTKTFCQRHFLVGILLQEVKVALNEVRDVRRIAVTVLMNILAKHAFDKRYQDKSQQAILASLYLPFIMVILENLNRLDGPEKLRASTYGSERYEGNVSYASDANASVSSAASVSSGNSGPPSFDAGSEAQGGRAATLSVYEKQHKRDSSYLSVIAGQAYLSQGSPSLVDSASLSNSSSTLSANSQTEGGNRETECEAANGQTFNDGTRTTSVLMRYDKLQASEVKDLLVCFLYIVKNINEEYLIGWWQCFGEFYVMDFFRLIELCLQQFQYLGKKQIFHNGKRPVSNDVVLKALTLPARVPPPGMSNGGSRTLSACGDALDLNDDADVRKRVLLEANMATEVGLVVLDVLGVFCANFKELLLGNDGDNVVMRKVFDIYLSFLQIGQSEKLLKHVFAALRAFLMQFPSILFDGTAILCGKLCYEILKCCNSHLLMTRNEACALLYLMMKENYKYKTGMGSTRVHLQVLISVSQLQGDVMGLNNIRFQDSLQSLNKYANSDRAMQHTNFPSQVTNLTKRIRAILMATLQMQKNEYDPEMLIDLQHSLANSYAANFELRKTWLQNIAKLHLSNESFSEAAFCYIHVAALIAEYLKQKGSFQGGCETFTNISPNVVKDEKCEKDDAKMQDSYYTEDCLMETLAICAEMLEKAERYELIPEIYKISTPIFERRKDYQTLASCYKHLHNVYSKIIETINSGKRLLGTFYRIAFFGKAHFGEDSGKEYIYKEPKVTSLPEISERLYSLFCKKFGKDNVKMIMDSIEVHAEDLDPNLAYVQVTHVMPFMDENLANNATEFEKNNNIYQFLFETPFTMDGHKARGAIHEQCKRKTILTTKYAFPYIKKRIEVISKTLITLNPIEVAIEEMETRVKELIGVTTLHAPDLKKLQLKLQGSISVQVNAGPLTYAKAFLEETSGRQYSSESVSRLKAVFRAFVHVCAAALDMNERLITSEQHEYHEALKENFHSFVKSLSHILNEHF